MHSTDKSHKTRPTRLSRTARTRRRTRRPQTTAHLTRSLTHSPKHPVQGLQHDGEGLHEDQVRRDGRPAPELDHPEGN